MDTRSTKKRTFSTAATKSILPQLPISSQHKHRLNTEHELLSFNSSLLVSKRKIDPVKERIPTQHVQSGRNKSRESKLYHQFSKHVEKIIQPQIEEVLEMFKTINLLRQKQGLISMREEGQGDDYYFQQRQIPYNAQLRQMNEQICSIKRQIQDKIIRIIKMVKPYPKLRHIVESLLEESSKEVLHENSKTGKIAAMKAHRRIVENNKTVLEKIGKF